MLRRTGLKIDEIINQSEATTQVALNFDTVFVCSSCQKEREFIKNIEKVFLCMVFR